MKTAKPRSKQLKSSNYSLKKSLNGTLKITSSAKSLVKNIANSGYLTKVEDAYDSLVGLIGSDYKNALVIGPFVMKLLLDVVNDSNSDVTRFKDSLDTAESKLESLKDAIKSTYTTLPSIDDAEIFTEPRELTLLNKTINNNLKAVERSMINRV